jgi:HPt (histidine-containing phosphotransfer) domain-containing protein
MLEKEEVLKEIGISEEIYDEMVLEFIQQARDNLPKVENSCAEGNFKEAQSIIHSLKGVAGNLRVTPAYNTAITLEQAIIASRIQEIKGDILKLKTLIDELFLELNK